MWSSLLITSREIIFDLASSYFKKLLSIVYHLIAYTSASSIIIDYVCDEMFFSIHMIPMLVLISNVERMINGMNAYVEHHSIDPNLIQDTNYYNYFSIGNTYRLHVQ